MQKQIDALRKDNKDDASRSAATGKSRAGKTRAASPGSPQRKAAGAAAPVPSPARTLGEQINAVVPDKEANKRVDVMLTKYDKTAITALFGHWGFLRFSASYQREFLVSMFKAIQYSTGFEQADAVAERGLHEVMFCARET